MDVRAAVALSLIEGVSRTRVAACLREATAAMPAGSSAARLLREVLARLGPSAGTFQVAESRAAEMLERAGRVGLSVVSWGTAVYPPLLAQIHDPPPVLWVRGRHAPLSLVAVGIVGARAATRASLESARQLGEALVRRGVVVVSGLARGVDSAAHRGALDGGGPTVAVLGCGGDRIYPPEHGRLADEIAARGAVVTELAPGLPPLPEHFPLRNRIISGLTRAVVVVEATERSGSLITARCALEQGREVMAMPGPSLGGRNRGAHALIKDGAKLVEDADDILEELPEVATLHLLSGYGRKELRAKDLTQYIEPGEACSLDDLAQRSGRDPVDLLADLLHLELQGRVARVAGGRFVAVGRRVVT